MSTDLLRGLNEEGKHGVGSLNTPMPHVETVPHGAIAGDAMDNFTLAEISEYDDTGKPVAISATSSATEAYLVASVEQRFLGEGLSHFYNGEGDDVRLVVLKDNLRFETSSFEGELSLGDEVVFDATDKVFKAGAVAGLGVKFVVVGDTSMTAGNYMQPTVRLSVSTDVTVA